MERGRHYELGQEIVPPLKLSETSPKNLELYYSAVIPAQAGIQELGEGSGESDLCAAVGNLLVPGSRVVHWIPACAGMTEMMPPPT